MAVQTVLPQSEVSLGVSIVLFASNFGPAVAIPIAQTIFTAKLQDNLKAVDPGIDANALETMGLMGLRTKLGEEGVKALSESLRETWYLSVGLACAMIVGAVMVEWRSVKHKTS